VRTHQALYRRWRAQTFGEIVGQEPVVQTLQNAVRSNKVAHALLFVGPRGTGKTSMARIVAKALNCTGLVDGEPDDTCEACVSIREGRALDVIEMDAASNNKVDDIREFLPRVATVPSSLRRKVFIVDEVQRIKEGWDLLLKTLEEPPDHVAFIFCTTDASQVRPAVLSRIQRFDFRPLTVPQIEGKLRRVLDAEGRAADDDAIGLVARLAAGGMRDAESMLDQLLTAGADRLTADQVRELLGIVETETVASFIEALVVGDPLTGMRILATLEDRGRDLRAFLNQVVDGLRESLMTRLTDGARGGPPADALAAAARRLASIDPNRAGPGGLRFQLELALLAPSVAPQAKAASSVTMSPAPAARSTGASPSVSERDVRSARAPNVRATPTDPRSAAPIPAEPVPVASVPAASVPAAAVLVGPSGAGAPTTARAPAPSTSPAPAGQSAGQSATNGTPDTPLDALYRVWPDVVAWISQMPAVKPLIVVCRPIAMDGNVVTLGFPESQGFLKDVAERRRTTLEEGVAKFLGRAVAVRCVATNLELAPPAPPDQEAERLLAEARRIFADDLVDIGEVS
jgi:DNA polymerase-3 subunit gamma/tau